MISRVAFTLAVVLACSVARAQQVDVEAEIHEAVGMRQRGDDEGALRVLREAYERTHSAHVEAQMAMAEQALGRWIEAGTHMREALASSDAWVVHHRAQLDGAMHTIGEHVGSLEVRGGVPGAEVRVDGRVVGTLPMSQPVLAVVGTVTLEVHAQGYVSIERRVVITAGGLARESVELVPAPPPASSSPAPSAAPIAIVEPLAVSPATALTPETTSEPSGARRAATVAIAVLAVLSAGGGLAANLVRESWVSAYNGDSCDVNGATRRQNCGWMLTTIDRLEALEVAGYALGGVLAATTVILVVTTPHASARRETHARFACGQGPGAFGIACAGVF
jgi:hypothetical protein